MFEMTANTSLLTAITLFTKYRWQTLIYNCICVLIRKLLFAIIMHLFKLSHNIKMLNILTYLFQISFIQSKMLFNDIIFNT